MQQKFLIFLALIFLIVVLVGLNAASYVQKDKVPDSEFSPNRSTFNTGATGTRAFYDLLAETGRRPVRWQESTSALLAAGKNKPQTFVVIGRTRREFDDKEIEQLFRWVSEGGKLVVIDRDPPKDLIRSGGYWNIAFKTNLVSAFSNVDPSDQNQMTEKTTAAKPAQPTVYTQRINAVQPSRFASSINFERYAEAADSTYNGQASAPPPKAAEDNNDYYGDDKSPTPKHSGSGQGSGIGNGTGGTPPPPIAVKLKTSAPVAHIADDEKTLLADFPFGSGRIVYLTDPYIVSNNGINLVDNAQLAINVVASGEGVIAFDEFHQGYGAGENQLLNYFTGTPAVAIFLQFAALIAFVFFTQSRRFARPLPEFEPNRLSKLEYVSAMAELQQRTRAFDLAIENIYTEFRRRTARLVGADNFAASYKDLALLISERAKLNRTEVERLMFKCEDIIRGEPTNKKEVLELTTRLREIEEKLGLKRRKSA